MPEGRRRLAAIMFTDLVGYSALAQRDEPLALSHVDEQRTLVRPLFEKHGGREVKTMGDGALVEFDSALDATECAVEIQRRLFERNRERAGEPLQLRVGIHVGDVVHTENDVFGDAVNIASRIEPLAEPGGVCVSGPVHEQVHNKLPYPWKPLERVVLKNIEAPVSVYRIELPWTPPSLSAVTPFTDRRSELERLGKARSAMEGGGGQVVLLVGEAGVGKSRLAEEFLQRAERAGTQVLRGRADSAGTAIPFSPWTEAIREFAREAPNPLLYKVCADCAGELVELVPELKSRFGAGAEMAPTGEPSSRRLLEGAFRFLEALGREAPLVVELDDFQAADDSSMQLLEYVGRRLAGRRILIVVSVRTEPTAEASGVEGRLRALEGEHFLELIPLARLDAPTSAQFVGQMLGGRLPSTGGALSDRLFEKSGGNPMILEAVVRSLVSEGALVWSEAGWAPKAGVEVRLPPGIQSIVRRRLQQLDPHVVDLLRQASVLGSQFSFEALSRMTGEPAEALLPSLEKGLAARLLEERPTDPGRSLYAFSDRPVREALYEEISLVRRARYHASAARALEALASEGVHVPAAELADHCLRANDYPRALEHTVRAAEDAARLYAREEALRQYGIALELLESHPDERRRAAVLFQVGDQLDLLGRHTEAYRSMRESAELYEQLGRNVEAGEAHRSIARRINAHNEPVRAMEHLEKARRLLEGSPPSVELARLFDTTGTILFQEVRLAEAAASWRKAIEVAHQVGSLKIEASSRMMLAAVVPPEETAKVWENLDAALALASKAEARTVVPNVLMLRSIALLHLRGDGRGALRAAEDAIEYARRGQDVLYEMTVKGGVVSYIHWRLGDLERAEAVALEHRSFAGGDPHRERPTAIAVLAEVALARGEVDRAEKLLWEAEHLLADGGDWTESAQTQLALARCAALRDRHPLAVERLRTARELCRKAGPPAMDALLLAETLSLLVRESLEGSDLSSAESCLGELRSLRRVVEEGGVPAYCARAEGWAHAHRGDPRLAVAAHAAAVDRWKRLGWQYEWAQSALALAAVHRDLGETSRARELSDQAAELLSRAGVRG